MTPSGFHSRWLTSCLSTGKALSKSKRSNRSITFALLFFFGKFDFEARCGGLLSLSRFFRSCFFAAPDIGVDLLRELQRREFGQWKGEVVVFVFPQIPLAQHFTVRGCERQ